MKIITSIVLRNIAASALGALLTFAFAPYTLYFLAMIALAGFMILFYPLKSKAASLLGFSFGLGFFGAGVYWVFIAMHQYTDTPVILAVLITALLVSFLSLFTMATCFLTKRYFNNRSMTTQLVFAFPSLWVLFEWLRSILFTGFPWLFVGYSQLNSPLRGYAPILSVYLVSLSVLMCSGLIASAYFYLRSKQIACACRALLFCAAIWILGALLSTVPWSTPTGKALEVSLVQGNIPQSLKWSPESVYLSFERYEELTQSAWGKNRIVIWPEAAIPVPLQDAESFIQTMDDKAWSTGTHLLMGIPIRAEEETYYNSIITLGATRQVYSKRRLVPYGEYVPFKKISASIFDFMKIPMANMVPGNLVQHPLTIMGVSILPSVCYEITYPELMNPRNPNIGVLLTITNDAWYGHSNAQAQHLQMAAMRSLELGRPLLFVSNDGITAIIGPQGNIQASAPPYETYVLNGTVQPMFGYTPWMKNGMDPMLAILIGLLMLAFFSEKNIEPSNECLYERNLSTARD